MNATTETINIPALPQSAGLKPNQMARKKTTSPGTVYLIHLAEPIAGHAQHYIGWAKHLEARIKHHHARTGARLLQVAVDLHIDFQVVRTWEGDRHFERKLKNRKNARHMCPVCNKKH